MARVDISMPLYPGMPVFPGDSEFATRSWQSLARGDPYNISALALSSHAGTHLDPPSHFISGGPSVDQLDLDLLNGPCQVVEVDLHRISIGPDSIEQLPRNSSRILFRTSNSARWAKSLTFFPDYVALTLEAAKILVERKVQLVGIDALSVENDPSGTFPVHHLLLGRGIPILEGLLLADAPPGEYLLECLPLRLREGDGGPARAALVSR